MGTTTPNETENWCLIESDPGVFYELIEQLGCTGFDFKEIYDLESLTQNCYDDKKYFGYIFLFKYDGNQAKISHTDNLNQSFDNIPQGLFAPKQVVNNACATIALLSVLLNQREVNLGSVLEGIRTFCDDSNSELQGLAITHNNYVRDVHNSFSGSTSFEFMSSNIHTKDDAFHFISYVPYEGKVYELDGLAQSPVCLGEYQNDDWHPLVYYRLKYRINNLQSENDANTEIRFNLMSVIENEIPKYKNEIDKTKSITQQAAIKLASFSDQGEDLFVDFMDYESPSEQYIDFQDLPNDPKELTTMISDAKKKLSKLKDKLDNLIQIKENWKKENMYRKHNFLPLVIATMKILAKKNKLNNFYSAALAKSISLKNKSTA